jgi:glutathione synthase
VGKGGSLSPHPIESGQLTDVTSPTGIRASARLGGPDIAALIWDKIEAKRA